MELFTVSEIAERLKLCSATIRRLGHIGAIRTFRVGRAIRYDLDEIVRWMKKQGGTVKPATAKERGTARVAASAR